MLGNGSAGPGADSGDESNPNAAKSQRKNRAFDDNTTTSGAPQVGSTPGDSNVTQLASRSLITGMPETHWQARQPTPAATDAVAAATVSRRDAAPAAAPSRMATPRGAPTAEKHTHPDFSASRPSLMAGSPAHNTRSKHSLRTSDIHELMLNKNNPVSERPETTGKRKQKHSVGDNCSNDDNIHGLAAATPSKAPRFRLDGAPSAGSCTPASTAAGGSSSSGDSFNVMGYTPTSKMCHQMAGINISTPGNRNPQQPPPLLRSSGTWVLERAPTPKTSRSGPPATPGTCGSLFAGFGRMGLITPEQAKQEQQMNDNNPFVDNPQQQQQQCPVMAPHPGSLSRHRVPPGLPSGSSHRRSLFNNPLASGSSGCAQRLLATPSKRSSGRKLFPASSHSRNSGGSRSGSGGAGSYSTPSNRGHPIESSPPDVLPLCRNLVPQLLQDSCSSAASAPGDSGTPQQRPWGVQPHPISTGSTSPEHNPFMDEHPAPQSSSSRNNNDDAKYDETAPPTRPFGFSTPSRTERLGKLPTTPPGQATPTSLLTQVPPAPKSRSGHSGFKRPHAEEISPTYNCSSASKPGRQLYGGTPITLPHRYSPSTPVPRMPNLLSPPRNTGVSSPCPPTPVPKRQRTVNSVPVARSFDHLIGRTAAGASATLPTPSERSTNGASASSSVHAFSTSRTTATTTTTTAATMNPAAAQRDSTRITRADMRRHAPLPPSQDIEITDDEDEDTEAAAQLMLRPTPSHQNRRDSPPGSNNTNNRVVFPVLSIPYPNLTADAGKENVCPISNIPRHAKKAKTAAGSSSAIPHTTASRVALAHLLMIRLEDDDE
ncbi:hypothetical protein DFJ77DRAFT_544278 [Powellomyces hirtus]|nr:hypothetical protein DFJ77DRAFT_544278 [Powellomyces hirtus]